MRQEETIEVSILRQSTRSQSETNHSSTTHLHPSSILGSTSLPFIGFAQRRDPGSFPEGSHRRKETERSRLHRLLEKATGRTRMMTHPPRQGEIARSIGRIKGIEPTATKPT